jgi:hypothetical protein
MDRRTDGACGAVLARSTKRIGLTVRVWFPFPPLDGLSLCHKIKVLKPECLDFRRQWLEAADCEDLLPVACYQQKQKMTMTNDCITIRD